MFFAACAVAVASAAAPGGADPAGAVTGPTIRFSFVYRVELSGGATLPAATIVPSRRARDFAELQTSIAELANVLPENVVLRDWATIRDPFPRIERGAAVGPPSHRVRLCSPEGALLADAVIPQDGGVLLVPVVRGGLSAVFAYRERLVPPDDLERLADQEQALTVEAERLVTGSRFAGDVVAAVGPCR
jgi:hypothetical protein